MLLGSRSVADESGCPPPGVLSDTVRSTCLVECEIYFKENPAARPSTTSRICQYPLEWLANRFSPLRDIRVIQSCARGVWKGLLSFSDQLKAYGMVVENLADFLRAESAENREWIRGCDADQECRRTAARMIGNYRMTKSDGQFVISDEKLDEEIKGRSTLELLLIAQTNKKTLQDDCLRELRKVNDRVKPPPGDDWTFDHLNNRYEELLRVDPFCPVVLNMSPPDPMVAGGSSARRSWLESLGIKWRCYEPNKFNELICYELASLVANPLNVASAGGGLAASALMTAGVRMAVNRAATSAIAGAARSQAKESAIHLFKKGVVDKMANVYAKGAVVNLRNAMGGDAQATIGDHVGSGVYGAVYRLSASTEPGLAKALSEGRRLVMKFPHAVKVGGRARPLRATNRASNNEVREFADLESQFPQVSAHPGFPANAPWTRLPVVPILRSIESDAGTIIIKPEITGMGLKELFQKYGTNLPKDIERGLREYYDFAQSLNQTVKVSVNRRGQQVTEGFSADLRPPNLIWVDDPEMFSLLGMTRPGFSSYELTQLAGNAPRYLQSEMPFERYLENFKTYMKRER